MTTDGYKTLLYEVDDRVAVITLNRADKMNALSRELCGEMQAAFARADSDEDVRVLVVKGAGGRAFSAGYDLGEEGVDLSGMDAWRKAIQDALEFTYAPWRFSKPAIAMISGYCLAGGLEFAQMHDIRYASEDSKFGVVETRFSSGVATLAMPWIIGPLSRELVFTGDMIDAETALRMGLINRVFPKDDLEAEVMKIAKRISRSSLAVLQWGKRAINQTFETQGFSAALRYAAEACVLLDITETPEGLQFETLRKNEGVQAALKWRKELYAPFE
jgi:enoyl-CoA hydratase